MQLEAVLWWQNHFGITLSQLLEHRYHVMHIRLPDKHNVVNHFCLQAFLSEQSFPSLSMSSVLLLLFCYFSRLAATRTSLRLLISFRVTLKVFSASRSCPWYWILSSSEAQMVFICLCQKMCSIQISYISRKFS